MHILVTGCTGFVGSSLARQLVGAGHQVRGLVRHPGQAKDATLGQAVELLPGSVLDPAALDRAMAGVEAVIHLVGILVETGQQTFQRVHVEGTRHVLEAAQRRGVRRYLHMSALGTRPHARSRYHQTKWAAEELVRASGLAWTIFRPSVIFGPRDNFVNQFARILQFSPIAPLLGDGSAKMQPVWVEDVAHCFTLALTNDACVDHVYDLVGPDQLPFRDIMRAILNATGKTRLTLPIPFALLRLEAAILERLLPTPPLTTDQLLMAEEDNVGDPEPMRRTFGVTPRAFADGLLDYPFP